ncbi:polyphosphatase DDP1, partial [Ascoidea rubescens DSM 1968]
AREGRENQYFNPATGARVVAGSIPLSSDLEKVLLITSTSSKSKWILPKGGVEKDELTVSDAENLDFSLSAKRETWEEAGVEGLIVKKLGVFHDKRDEKILKKMDQLSLNRHSNNLDDLLKQNVIPRTEYHLYEISVDILESKYPESHKRERKWCDYKTAKYELLKSRRLELLEALNHSRIVKN